MKRLLLLLLCASPVFAQCSITVIQGSDTISSSRLIINDNFACLATNNITVSRLNSGINASLSTFWRGDGTWAAVTTGNASQLQGRNISATAPTPGQELVWNASTSLWEPGTASTNATQIQGRNVSSSAPSANQILTWNISTLVWEPADPSTNATQLQSRNISSTAPTQGQVLTWNAFTALWEPGSASIPGVTSAIGTPNQIAVSAATGAVTFSIPTNPILPGSPTISNYTNAGHTHADAANGGLLTEVALNLSNVTTGNVNASRHGFVPILPSDSTKYLDGTGVFTVPPGGSSGPGTFIDWQATKTTSISGSTDQTVFSSTVPAIPAGACITVELSYYFSTVGTGVDLQKLFYGTQAVILYNGNTSNNNVWRFISLICNNPGLQNAQTISFPIAQVGAGGVSVIDLGTPATAAAIDATAPQVVKFTANAVSGVVITSLLWHITADTTTGGGGGGGGAVNNVTGTTNQINCSPTTGNVICSIPTNPVIPGAPTVSSFLNATHTHISAATGGQLAEAALNLTNITTGNVSTSRHGFAPILPNDATKFLNGIGTYTVPSGSGGATNFESLTDCQVIRTDDVTLTINGSATSDIPCNVRVGAIVTPFSGPGVITLSAGSGSIKPYIKVSGTPILEVAYTGVTLSSCTGMGCVTVSSSTYPSDGLYIPLTEWLATVPVTWDATGIPMRAVQSFSGSTGGTGISVTQGANGLQAVAVDSTVTRTSQPFVVEGANAYMGVATLSSGSATVSTTAVAANSRIFLTPQDCSPSIAGLRQSSRTPGTSFVISSDGSSSCVVAWLIESPQ